MQKIREQLRRIKRLPHSRLKVAVEDNEVTVTLPNGRHQHIEIKREGDQYVFTSIVLGKAETDRIKWLDFAKRVWDRNRQSDVVAFHLDERDRLVGCIAQWVKTVDLEELQFYLACLARECDRMEYLLTGQDAR